MDSVLGRDPIAELTTPEMRARVLSAAGRFKGLAKSPAKTKAARQNAKKPRLRSRGNVSAKKRAVILENLKKARQTKKARKNA